MSDAPQTRPCPDCASPVRTADQSFCDSCGAFLRWDTPAGTPAAADPPAADRTPPATTADAADGRSGHATGTAAQTGA
ncbi:hypothetical protein ACWGK1_23410, partial [Streptomyces wedmorensis]